MIDLDHLRTRAATPAPIALASAALLFVLVLLAGRLGAFLVIVAPVALALLAAHQGAAALAVTRPSPVLAAEGPERAPAGLRSRPAGPNPSRRRAASGAEGAASVLAALAAPAPRAPRRPRKTGEGEPAGASLAQAHERAASVAEGAAGVVAALAAAAPETPRRPGGGGERVRERARSTPAPAPSPGQPASVAEGAAGVLAALTLPGPAVLRRPSAADASDPARPTLAPSRARAAATVKGAARVLAALTPPTPRPGSPESGKGLPEPDRAEPTLDPPRVRGAPVGPSLRRSRRAPQPGGAP